MSASAVLVGNVTREPELRFTPNGAANVSFGIACNRRWQANGEWQEATSFFNVVAWGTLAENVAACIAKGSRVTVSGRLEQRSWETPEGEKRSAVEVVADEVSPSLRFATVIIARNERRTPNDDPALAALGSLPLNDEPF